MGILERKIEKVDKYKSDLENERRLESERLIEKCRVSLDSAVYGHIYYAAVYFKGEGYSDESLIFEVDKNGILPWIHKGFEINEMFLVDSAKAVLDSLGVDYKIKMKGEYIFCFHLVGKKRRINDDVLRFSKLRLCSDYSADDIRKVFDDLCCLDKISQADTGECQYYFVKKIYVFVDLDEAGFEGEVHRRHILDSEIEKYFENKKLEEERSARYRTEEPREIGCLGWLVILGVVAYFSISYAISFVKDILF